jgi:hypothetical protein
MTCYCYRPVTGIFSGPDTDLLLMRPGPDPGPWALLRYDPVTVTGPVTGPVDLVQACYDLGLTCYTVRFTVIFRPVTVTVTDLGPVH